MDSSNREQLNIAWHGCFNFFTSAKNQSGKLSSLRMTLRKLLILQHPKILSNFGEFFFAFVLLEMIEISQGFKTFEFIYKLYFKNHFKLPIFHAELL
jgi:hypothetical protein